MASPWRSAACISAMAARLPRSAAPAGSIVVVGIEVEAGVDVVAVVVVVLVVPDEVQAVAPMPTAATPRATSSLRMTRGYPWGRSGDLAPAARPSGKGAKATSSNRSAEPRAPADVIGYGERGRGGRGRSVSHVQDAVAFVEPEVIDQGPVTPHCLGSEAGGGGL